DAPDRGLPEVDALEARQRVGEVAVGGLRVTGRELGQADAAAPDRPDHRLVGAGARGLPGGIEPPGVRVQGGPPRSEAPRLDALLLERVAQAPGERRRLGPVARPGLHDQTVEQDVGERRLVALVARLPLGLDEPSPGAVEVVYVPKPLPQ